MKTCSKCGISKPESEFQKHSGVKSGLRPDCKACCKARDAEKYQRRKDAVRLAYEKRYAQKREEYIAANIRYREQNASKWAAHKAVRCAVKAKKTNPATLHYLREEG